MFSTIVLELLLILCLVLLNGVFAMSEIAVISARRARLHRLAASGNRNARAALELAASPGAFLSTVQVGITLIGVLAGAYGGATIAEQLAAMLASVPLLEQYSEGLAIGLVVLAISYLSLILGELVPKRLALNNPERIAAAVARPIRFLAQAASPAVRFLSASTDAVLWLLRVSPTVEPPVTEDEIKIMIEQGTRSGVFKRAESDMLESVFRLGDRRVGALMTARTDIIPLLITDTPAEIRSKIAAGFSRYPVCDGNLDNLIGIVFTKDLLSALLAGRPMNPLELTKQPLLIPESTQALQLLEQFRKTGKHLAMVVDEYGGVQGLVTTNDILEAIVGELSSMGDPSALLREDGSWLIDGLLPVDEFRSLLHVERLPGEESGDYQTLGGFIMSHLGRIPAAGDRFHAAGLLFEVMDIDGHRIDKVLVRKVSPET